MFSNNVISKLLKVSSLAALVVASTLAYAGPTVKITNTSKQPWTLRITEDATVPVMAQGTHDQATVELSHQNNKLAYSIQPGETCILQFKEMKESPLKQSVGLVDKEGTERGQLSIETRRVPQAAQGASLAACSECCELSTSLAALDRASEVVERNAEDAVSITADTWS